MLFFWFFKNCELIRDSSLWRSNFTHLVHDSIIIIGSRCYTYTFGSRFDYKRWVKVSIKNLNFSFLGQVFQYFCWVSKRVDWGSHHLPWLPLSTIAPSFDRGYPDHAGKLPWPPPASQLPTKKPSLWLFFSCARWVWEQGDRSNDGRRRRKLELTGGASDLGGGDWWKGEPEVARFLERNLIWESLAWSDWLTVAVKRMICIGV